MNRRKKHSRNPRLLETLEPRQLLSATFLNAIGFGTSSDYGEAISSMATDSAGNIIVAGYFQGTMDVDPSAGVHNITSNGSYNYDMFLIKYTAAGNLLWVKTFDSPGNEMAAGITVDASDHIMLTGSFTGTLDMDPGAGVSNIISNGDVDALVAKLDSSGNLIWAKSYGGTAWDDATKIVSDNQGGFLLIGNFQGTADLDPGVGVHNATTSGLGGVYMTHIDSAGDLIWSDQFTATNNMWIANLAVDNAGNIYAAGSMQGTFDADPSPHAKFLGNGNHLLAFVAKFNSNGKLSWAKQFGQGTDGTFVYDMTRDADGNLILVGSFGGSGDFDPGPRMKTLTEHQSPDAFTGYVMKLNSNGGFKWAGPLLGDWWSDAYAVTTDASDNIYVTGEINGTNTLDITGTGNDTLTSRGQDDAFLAKYDPAGHVAWVEQMGSPTYDHGLRVVLGPGSTLYASGYFSTTAHFGPLNAGVDLTALGNQDSFIAIFDQSPATPTATLAAVQDSSVLGRRATFTATVAPAQGIATGFVVFKDGTKVIGRVKLDDNGHAVLHKRGIKTGVHHITVSYDGDENFLAVTSVIVDLNVV